MTDSAEKVLVVDDETQTRRLLRAGLEVNGYRVIEAGTALEALRAITLDVPDLVILDRRLPDADGFEVISRVREWSSVPIIVLSGCTGEADKISALDGGANDYVTKPCAMGELLARIRVALREHRAGGLLRQGVAPVYEGGDLAVDLEYRRVTVRGQHIRLSRKEYALLRILVTHAGKVITHQDLLREVWGPAHLDDTQYLRVYIGQLRQKIEPDPAQPTHIVTEPGIGYRLRQAETRQEVGEVNATDWSARDRPAS
ncbi:MAG: response regulator transcription factor [Alphaproteobacteria bacterium]